MPDSTSSPDFIPTARTRVRRLHERGRYDRETIYAILDAALMCHVGYVIDGLPYVTPTLFWRECEQLYWHGSSASRMLRRQAEGIPVCVTVSHVDGLVVARSGFHHSLNYRAVMAFGTAAIVADAVRDRRSAVRRSARDAPLRRSLKGFRGVGHLLRAAEIMPPRQTAGAVRLVHSSDIHVDEGRIAAAYEGDGTAGLAAVLATARALRADVVLLAGDTFETNQLSGPVIDRAGGLLADAGMPVVILPGNHDPALPDSIYVKGGYAQIADLSILGVTHDEAAVFAEFDLEIWGRAHRDYFDMPPLRGSRPRSTRWQVAIGHGHYEPPETRANPLRPSWVFGDEEIAATAADYLALGHWDRPMRVGDGAVPAYYSGSPELAGTVNLVRLTAAGEVVVTREALGSPCPA